MIRGDSAHELTAPADSEDAPDAARSATTSTSPTAPSSAPASSAISRARNGAWMLNSRHRLPHRRHGLRLAVRPRVPHLERLPADERQLRQALQARGIGTLEIKKRGVDVDPAALRTRLKLRGADRATLVLTREQGRHVALLVERPVGRGRRTPDQPPQLGSAPKTIA